MGGWDNPTAEQVHQEQLRLFGGQAPGMSQAPQNPNKVFIGGLSSSTTDATLANHLAAYQPITCGVTVDRQTGRSRGSGFAEFSSSEMASLLMQMNNVVVDGIEVIISPWTGESDAPAMDMSGGFGMLGSLGAPGLVQQDQLKVFVGGLSQNTTKESLNAHFSQFGYADSFVMIDGATGRSRGFGFVNFTEPTVVAQVLAHQHEVDGVVVNVSPYQGGPKGTARASGPAVGGPPLPGPLDKGGLATRDQLKIFVGGLSQATTKESLDAYFSQFGYADAYIMTDRATGRSRGFGFINFGDPSVMDMVLGVQHEVDGVPITTSPYGAKTGGKGGCGKSGGFGGASVGFGGASGGFGGAPGGGGSFRSSPYSAPSQPASTGASAGIQNLLSQLSEKLQGATHLAATRQQQQQQQAPQSIPGANGAGRGQYKLFVGGLSQNTTKGSLDAYFSQFGYADSIVMVDKQTGRSRGFGFVNFGEEQIMRTVLEYSHEIDGTPVSISSYEDKNCSKGGGPVGGGKGVGGGCGQVAAVVDQIAGAAQQISAAAQGGGNLGSNSAEILSNAVSLIQKLAQDLAPGGGGGGGGGQSNPFAVLSAGRQFSSSGPSSFGESAGAKLFVAGLAQHTAGETLQQAFSLYGPCECEVALDKLTGRSRGFGFVNFANPSNATEALSMQHVIDGRQVEVSECWEKGSKPSSGVGR